MSIKSVFVSSALTFVLAAGATPDVALKNWPAPLYWQPSEAELKTIVGRASAEARTLSPGEVPPLKSLELLFVAMTPCRVVDTRASQMFPAGFGAPSLTPGPARSFPIQSSTLCSIPSTAQAYSFNVTVVPPGTLGYLTLWLAGQPQPNAVTLDDVQGQIVNNAAIVLSGQPNGSISAVVNGNTDLVIDINGYYVGTDGITLDLGTAGLPALNFAGDSNTGIFSSGNGMLNFATNGVTALTVRPDSDLDLAGNIRKGGALFLHNVGNQNTGVGLNALPASSGNLNTAIGDQALNINSTGAFNTAVGSSALASTTTGSNNTAIGSGALDQNQGSDNIAIGSGAGFGIYGTASQNIDIGNAGIHTDNGVIRIGTALFQTSFFAAGIRGVQTGQPNAVNVMIDSNGQLGTINSSRQFKEDIQDMGKASSGLMSLRPVTYRYREPYSDGSKPLDYGLIAEEVAEVYLDLVVKNADGNIQTVQYHKLTPMLLNELQKEHTALEQEHTALEQEHETVRSLQAQVAALRAALEKLLASVPPVE